MSTESTADQIREAVRERYANAAKEVRSRPGSSCCSGTNVSKAALYRVSELEDLPENAVLASLGCGNPTLLAELKPGERVLDLGSGGGIDVLLSAKRVGPTGKAYGLDMTDEMLELALSNAREAKVTNVEFLKGQIEAIPLPRGSVDVIISNCVINLSADKDAVIKEAYRVLAPGGRFAVADIVVQGDPLPAEAQQKLALWTRCIGGALTEEEYRSKLAAAGFIDVDMEVLRDYGVEKVPEEVRVSISPELARSGKTRLISAFIRATKPEGTAESKPMGTASPVAGDISASSCCGGAPGAKQTPGCCG